VAKTLSGMITELALSKQEEKESREPHLSSAVAATIQQEATDAAATNDDDANGEVVTDSLAGLAYSENAEPNKGDGGDPGDKAKALQQATTFVDETLKALDDTGSGSSSKKGVSKSSSKSDSSGISLLDDQKTVVKAVEDRWQRVRVGSILRGAVASGKTIATCALLWRNRSTGPQLLLCSSACMVRFLLSCVVIHTVAISFHLKLNQNPFLF